MRFMFRYFSGKSGAAFPYSADILFAGLFSGAASFFDR